MTRKWFLVLLVLALFVGCVQPTLDTPSVEKTETPAATTPDTPNTPDTPATPEEPDSPAETPAPYYVKNSAWETVDISGYSGARAAAPSFDQALEIVADYNAANDDDQLHLDTIDVPIEEASEVKIYIVKAVTYAPISEYLVPRIHFRDNRYMYEAGAMGEGGILFVEKVPPAPIIPPDLRTREEKYALYMISVKTGKIVVYNGFRYELHIDKEWDSFDDALKADYGTIDNLMDWRVKAFKTDEGLMVADDSPWRVVSGQLYVEPPDPETSE